MPASCTSIIRAMVALNGLDVIAIDTPGLSEKKTKPSWCNRRNGKVGLRMRSYDQA